MSYLLRLLTVFALFTPLHAQEKSVVELFTSQGCSSCPPADRYFGELNSRPNLILISWNVDYWDYLGWKDTLGDPSHTKRQRSYSMDNKVYTPQMVVNGKSFHVGSEKREVEGSLAKQTNLALPMAITQDGDKITVRLPASAYKNLTIMGVGVASKREVKILRGENKGENAHYHRVARGMISLGSYDGTAQEIVISRREKIALDADRLVVLIQAKDEKQALKSIVGAAEISLQ